MGGLITNEARCTREIKSSITVTKAAFNKKRAIFTTQFDLNFWKKLIKCYVWSTPLYGAETWTLRDVDRNTPKVLRCGAGEGRRRWVGMVVWDKKCYIDSRRTGIFRICHIFRRNYLIKHVIEGNLEGRTEVKGGRRRWRKLLLDDLKETKGYWKLKEKALDRILRRTRFGYGYGPFVRQLNDKKI